MGQLIHHALIVDDEQPIREATSRAMSAHDFCCDTASDGHKALKLYRHQRHDLVVTDLRMPNFHGHSLILELLKDEEPPKIVVLTGIANTRIAQDLRTRGVDDIVSKPVDFQIFAANMHSLLDPDGWAIPIEHGRRIRAGNQRHPLVQKMERALEFFSVCIPGGLDDALRASTRELSEPPAKLIQFLERLSAHKQPNHERRKFQRIPVFSTACAIPVDKDFNIQGEPISVTFNDLSEQGACLFHTRPFPTEYVALRWRSLLSKKQYLTAVMQVSRCMPLGPFYEIAGPFVMHD